MFVAIRCYQRGGDYQTFTPELFRQKRHSLWFCMKQGESCSRGYSWQNRAVRPDECRSAVCVYCGKHILCWFPRTADVESAHDERRLHFPMLVGRWIRKCDVQFFDRGPLGRRNPLEAQQSSCSLSNSPGSNDCHNVKGIKHLR